MKTFRLTNNRTLDYFHDEYAESPRSWYNLGTMICFHKRYDLGDEHVLSSDSFNGWNEIEKYIIKNYDAAVVLPIYMYDHGGITINTTGFSCPWDSGQVGFIYVSNRKLRSEYNIKKVSKKFKDLAKDILIGEVDTYSKYLEGDVYGFSINGEESMSGFYGYDIVHNGVLDYLSKEDRKLVLEQI